MTLPSQSIRELAEKAALDLESLKRAAEACVAAMGRFSRREISLEQAKEPNLVFAKLTHPVSILQLIARLEASERDGERYRWLADNTHRIKVYVYDDPDDAYSGDWLYKPRDLNEVIDAEIAIDAQIAARKK